MLCSSHYVRFPMARPEILCDFLICIFILSSYFIMNKIIILSTVLIILILLFCNKYDNENTKESNIKKLVRQTARWATAADQDDNGYIANLHATYAMGYLMALREIYTDVDIEVYCGVDVRKFESEISIIMDNAIKKLVLVCPDGQPKNRYLATISKEGLM